MLRVGYPAVLAAELFSDFPPEVELIALPDDLDHEIEIDVWIPDPYATRAIKIWPHLRGVRLVLALMAGTAMLAGCGSSPTTRTTSSSEQSTTTMPAPPPMTTTNTTTQQNTRTP